MLSTLLRSVHRASPVTGLLMVILLGGCGSPEQRSQGYFESGMALLAKNDDLNARVELLTSLKFKSDRIEAWRALAGIDERAKSKCSFIPGLEGEIVELDPKGSGYRGFALPRLCLPITAVTLR